MTDRPLLLPLVALIAGILLAYRLWVPLPVWVVLCLLSGAAVAGMLQARWLYGVLSLLFWASCGMAMLSVYVHEDGEGSDLKRFDGRQVIVEGVLTGRPVRLQQGQRIDLRVETVIDSGLQYRTNDARLLVTLRSGSGDWRTGDRIRMGAVIRVPRLLGLPGEFPYPRYLSLQGYRAVAWVRDAEGVVLIRGAAEQSVRRVLDHLALRSQEVIRGVIAEPERRGVLLALATGTQHELAPDQVAAYTRAGVTHILSVSGFHVGIVAALWVFVIRRLLVRSEWLALRLDLRRVALLSALPLMLAYLLFTGAAWATARSVLMLSLFVIALWLEREADPLDALLAAGFLLLLVDPACLFDLSFQLSFMALWGLIVLTPLLLKPFERWLHGWRALVLQSCAASLAATAATLVPVLVAFHQASLSGIVANLLVVPLLGYGATVLATAAVPLTLVAPAWSELLLVPAGWLVAASNAVIDLIARVPVVRSYRLDTTDLAATVLVLGIISFVREQNRKRLGVAAVFGLLLLVRLLPTSALDGTLKLYALSVGQGDSTLIRLPDGRTLLVDGGGYLYENGRDFGERYLVPALHHLGVRQLDAMVLTHAHPDHLGGLPAVAEQFKVREFWQGGGLPEGSEYRRLLLALKQQGTFIRTVRRGDQPLSDGELQIRVLAAPDRSGPAADDGNDDSLVLQLRMRDFSALLMGDAGIAVEEQLVREGIGKTTLLKVGHHGSMTASGEKFLAAVRPEAAVLSVGAGNRFGLPAAEILQRLERHAVSLFRTDQQGTILVSSDGTGFRAEPLLREHRLTSWLRCFVLTGSGCCDNN